MSEIHGLTVRQLKELLASMPDSFDDRIVVVSSDPEGNRFDTVDTVEVGWFRNYDEDRFRGGSRDAGQTWEQVEQKVTEEYLTDEYGSDELVELDECDHPAICIWP